MRIIEQVILDKSKVANLATDLTGEELMYLQNKMQKAAPYIIGGTIASGLAAPAAMIYGSRKGIKEGERMPDSSIMNTSPYLTSSAGTIASRVAAPYLSVIPFSGAALHGVNEGAKAAIATKMMSNIKAGKDNGILASYSKEHPYLGPALSAFVPGLGGVNAHVAGESLADNAIESDSFMNRHPYLSTYMSSVVPIPGFLRSHAHAAAKILNNQERGE